jgi:hypothetical protein
MPEPELSKIPTEIFGYAFTDRSSKAKVARDEQYCPFLQGECKKPRKSEPHIKIGVCSVGYAGIVSEQHVPVIICPHRLDLQVVFDAVTANAFGALRRNEKIVWAREVSLGGAGSVDFVGVKVVGDDMDQLDDFICVELQATGTTGTPWQAVLEYKKNGRFSKAHYDFGINWANEFLKTMMQQVYKKGRVLASWNRKLIFAIQDVALNYIRQNCDTSRLRAAQPADPIHFYTFKMVWSELVNAWKLALAEMVSTDVMGIEMILAGANQTGFISERAFIENVKRKLG